MNVKEKENEQLLDEKVRKDAEKIKKDVNLMVGDSVSRISQEFDKLANTTRGTVASAAETVKREVGNGLSQYNEKAQDVAEKVPGDIANKAAQYPWVAISIALTVGFLLGSFIKPSRKYVNQS
jgi:ElaB/YqjD/DUF883 family membrane-anchored ribosome-binding protein